MIIKAEWVNSVLRAVVLAEPHDADAQLSILCRALAVAAKTVGCDRDVLLNNLSDAYDAEPQPEKAHTQ